MPELPPTAGVVDSPSLSPCGGIDLARGWLSVVGSKWSLPILDCLAQGPYRYNRLLAELEPVSAKVLTQTLRRLEAERIVASDRVGRSGRRYRLTPAGSELYLRLRGVRTLADDVVAGVPSDGWQPAAA